MDARAGESATETSSHLELKRWRVSQRLPQKAEANTSPWSETSRERRCHTMLLMAASYSQASRKRRSELSLNQVSCIFLTLLRCAIFSLKLLEKDPLLMQEIYERFSRCSVVLTKKTTSKVRCESFSRLNTR